MPMRVPYAQSVHGEDEIAAVVEVLRTNTALGPKTIAFEKAIAMRFGKRYGVMVNSGSSANLLAIEITGMQPGDEVITPLLTFATVVAPLLQKGLTPVFIDVEEGTYIINPDDVERAITPKTKALMIPSLLGNIPNLEALQALAQKHDLWLIEDSCDTLGGKFNEKPTGMYSHITTTSFYGSHIINGAGGGGMVMVDTKLLADKLQVLRGWGRQSSLFGEGKQSEAIENRFTTELDGIPYDNKFIFGAIGYNFLPLELSAAFALVQLEKLDDFAARRTENFAELLEFFSQYEEYFILPKQTPGADAVWLAFPFTLRDDAPFTRLELATHLEKCDIQTRPIFTGNILKQPGFAKIPHRLAMDSYEHTERVMRGGLVFATHQGLSREQIDFMKSSVSDFLSQHAGKDTV